MSRRRINPETVLTLLREGHSQGAVGRKLGCNRSTIHRIATANGIDAQQSATKRAIQARRDFCQAERLELLNELVQKVRDLIPDITEPASLQHLATTVGILIDKRRLEDGEATSRAEVTDDARNRIARRVDELAARRRTEGVA